MLEKFLDRVFSEYGLAFAVLLFGCWQLWRQSTKDRERLWKIIERERLDREKRNRDENGH